MSGPLVQAALQAVQSVHLLPQVAVVSCEGDDASGANPFLRVERALDELDAINAEMARRIYNEARFGLDEDFVEDDEDFDIYTCTGCGAYSTHQGAEHACLTIDGEREVGGSFQ